MIKVMLLHDVNQLLYERKVTDKSMQEYFIERYMSDEEIIEVKKILKENNLEYSCDFAKLQTLVSEKEKENVFKIVR